MTFIKNIEHQKEVKLIDEVAAAKGQVVSKTLAQNKALNITLFAFSKGEEISEHSSHGDAMVQVLEGTAQLTIGGVKHIVNAGETIIMPAEVPHALFAAEDFKMLLTVVLPYETN